MNDDAGISGGSEHLLVAVYETEMQAGAARVALIKAGLEPGQIQMSKAASPGDVRSTAASDFSSKSLWGKLKDLAAVAPPRLNGAFADGLLRGHASLTLSPPAGERNRMIALLESTSPMAFDALRTTTTPASSRPPAAVEPVAVDQVTGQPPSPAAGDPAI